MLLVPNTGGAEGSPPSWTTCDPRMLNSTCAVLIGRVTRWTLGDCTRHRELLGISVEVLGGPVPQLWGCLQNRSSHTSCVLCMLNAFHMFIA